MRLGRITALTSAVIALVACDSADIEPRADAAADAFALDAADEPDSSRDALVTDASDDGPDVVDGGPLDAGAGDDGGADAGVCAMNEMRECGAEDVVVGGASRCRRGHQTCRGGCTDTCPDAMDDSCDDGRPSALSSCFYGTDCTDCGFALLEWSGCIDVVEPIDEVCDNGIDDDCDGMTDEECG